MDYKVSSIEEYLAVIPFERKEILEKLISILKEYFPEIIGDMEYRMPTYNPVCAMASQKNYVSFYVYNHITLDKYRRELGKLKVGKSCIRFRNMEQLPEKTIRKILSEIANKNS